MSEKEVEINIFEILSILYRSKIIFFFITLAFIICGYFIYNLQPITVLAKYDIIPISIKDANKYDQFNSVYNQLNSQKNEVIESEYLRKLFIERIKSYEDIELALINSQSLERGKFNSQNEYNKALHNLVLKFKIKENLKNQDSDRSSIKLIYTDSFDNINKEQITLLFEEIITSANENVRVDLINDFQNRIQFENLNKEFRKYELELNIENLRKSHAIQSQNRIIFLEEQAEMARHLGISDSLDVDNKYSNITNIIIEEDVKKSVELNQYYLIGYNAIEKEIELMKNRSTADPYIDELIYFSQRIVAIDNDITTDRAEDLFKLTPIPNKNDFASIKLNTNYHLEIEIISDLNKFLIIFGIIGLFLGSIFIIASHYVYKKAYF